MTIQEVKSKLCIYDSDNPDYIEGQRSDYCYCDNCFHGRDELARAYLDLDDSYKDLESLIKEY